MPWEGGSGWPRSRPRCQRLRALPRRQSFPVQARSYFRAVSRRWRRRCAHPHPERSRFEAMGPVGRGRKPAGRGRRDRLAGARVLAAGRLHPDHGRKRSRHQPVAVSKIPYDTFKDFTPISLLASSPNMLLVRADSPFKTLADVIAAAKAKPGSLSFAHAGTGTSTHLAGELLKSLAKSRSQRHSLQGRRARDQRSAGRADSAVVQQRPGIGRRSSQAGTLRALAVTTASRAPFLPDVPSMAEAVPGYDTEVWWGLLGPGGMPADLRRKTLQRFRCRVEYRCGEGAAGETWFAADRQFVAAIRCQDSCRLRQMGADHQGRRHEGRVGQACE